jgi:hypothetical protein
MNPYMANDHDHTMACNLRVPGIFSPSSLPAMAVKIKVSEFVMGTANDKSESKDKVKNFKCQKKNENKQL